ncbi:hypothetical protein AMTR_s00145p00067200 [Amborella trichopoda]|uniref:Uncharacterized protein n=1 Tax=Amborella trichopoda TaxID=13333 RepID=W1PDB0_AMBTC|nr:hypothetical protein AMTR_s00145p00067200 [Amborella trichopoda]
MPSKPTVPTDSGQCSQRLVIAFHDRSEEDNKATISYDNMTSRAMNKTIDPHSHPSAFIALKKDREKEGKEGEKNYIIEINERGRMGYPATTQQPSSYCY